MLALDQCSSCLQEMNKVNGGLAVIMYLLDMHAECGYVGYVCAQWHVLSACQKETICMEIIVLGRMGGHK